MTMNMKEACQVIGAGDKNILNASVTQAIKYTCPELGALIFTYPHTENVLPAVHINTYGYVYSLPDNLSLATDMIVYSVEKYNCVYAFKRSLLPFLRYREHFIGDTADGSI